MHLIIGQSLINISRQTQTIKTLKKNGWRKRSKTKRNGKAWSLQKVLCSRGNMQFRYPVQGDEDMAMFDVTDSGIDATIELDDTQSQCSSETVESGFSAQVYCTLLIVI